MEASIMNKPASEMSLDELLALADTKRAEIEKEAVKAKNQYLKDKSNYLQEIANRRFDIQQKMTELKQFEFENAEKFNILKYELDGKIVKEAKSFELKSETIKQVIENQDRFDFTDEAIVHIEAIKAILKEKFEGRNKGMYDLLDTILMRNTKGDYDAKLLTKARAQVKKLGDQRLIDEFEKLTDCLQVVGTVKYSRVYVKNEKGGWSDISLNFSSL
ncbi:DUF3164 family protein [Empedobacter brevis]|uniref:DUF3164 family protein n=1 Tax=Empedobacter brevis TaxID=247 RepID=UPI00289F3AD2|nr:DUF3164 family protein [Empedobacter brevis]